MGIYSGVFVGVALLLTPILGSAGYIVANIVNMICRCAHHGLYLNRVSEKKIWRDILPDGRWLGCLIIVSSLLCMSEESIVPLFDSLFTMSFICGNSSRHIYVGIVVCIR